MDCHAEKRGPDIASRWAAFGWPLVIFGGLLALGVPRAAYAEDELPSAAVARSTIDEPDQRSAIVKSFRHDAALADVCFVDRATGWAVGDRGVIWHSRDGGATWQQQTSGVECGLNSVFFLDSRRGWAVGGECRSYANSSRGVVLRTIDGGENWTAVPRPMLPLLAQVKFFDANRGVAIGQATSFYPAGLFVTQDGGETWQALPADRAGGWSAGDFLDIETGAVAGPAGRFATLARRRVVHSPQATASLRSFHALRLVAPTGGWLVGDGGLVMTTGDLGHTWQTPSAELPEAVAGHFDFHAVAVQGPQVWVAGSPGTRVFHSPDGGQSWQAAPTGHQAPVRALAFADSEHGWAVGELGCILATRDGGRTWQAQRGGGRRAALLAVFADAADVPLELLADAGAAEGYTAAVEILHTADAGAEAAGQAHGERASEAMLVAGAAGSATAWRFPLPPGELALARDDQLAALNRANDGRALEQLESHLVRRLRMWRPDVVVTHHHESESSEPVAALVERLVLQAVERAADPEHAALATEIGLAPWQVKKVYGVLPARARGDESVATGRFSPWLGTTLRDYVSPARRLLLGGHGVPPDAWEFQLLMSQGADAGGPGGIIHGIALSHDSEARRPQAELPVNDLEALRRTATRRRHLEELLERTEGNAAWAGQVANLADGLPAADGAELLAQLADGYRATGRLDLAADTYYSLARRYPDHASVDRALIWLVQFYASSEAGHRVAAHQGANVRQASFDELEKAAPAVGLSREDRFRRAVQLSDYLKTTRPALYAEPEVRFAEVAAQRQLGFANPAKRYYLTLRELPENDPWRECAAAEEWLAQPAELPPAKTLGACRPADEPPHLDGVLDEPFWSTADRLRLKRGRESFSTGQLIRGSNSRVEKDSRPLFAAEVRLAYDAEFLYLAIHCPQVPGGNYRPDDSERPRDAELIEHDRVSLRIDVDRDYTTSFELSVDARGWTRDACWGDAHWNPPWYVAAASDEASWTIEAAVPLAELIGEPPTARHVWAVSAVRTIPRIGFESWAGDAAAGDSPGQFGLLIFE